MSGNFMFLTDDFPVLEKMGSLAEIYLYSDANACMYKMGSFAETVVNYIFELKGLTPPSGNDNTHANRIKILQKKDMLPQEIGDILYIIRIRRNEAVHEGLDSYDECITLIEMTHTLSVWFMLSYGNEEFEPVSFVMPVDIRKKDDYQKLLEENERLSAELEKAQEAAAARPFRPRGHARGQTRGPSRGPTQGPPQEPTQEPSLEPIHGTTQEPAQEPTHEPGQEPTRGPSRGPDAGHRRHGDRANRSPRLSERETRYIIETLKDEDGKRTQRERKRVKKTFRLFQLKAMGFVAILIGPLVLFFTSVVHDLRFPQSISETATIANRVGAILPFCLGALALFSFTYAIVHAFDITDKIFTFGMTAGFTIVAMQMCFSIEYIDITRVGLFGLSPKASDIWHLIGAVVGFGSMILWIMQCFRKSDKDRASQTKEKIWRNNIYFYIGLAMIASLSLLVFDKFKLFGEHFPAVFAAECAMLMLGGFACLLKGGFTLRDKYDMTVQDE